MTRPKEPTDREATEKRRRGSGVATVYLTIKSEILDLTLMPGSLIDEVELTKRFGMSRTPIREALVRLASDRLVVTLPNRSTVVAPVDLADLSAFFDALTLMYRVTTRLAAAYRTTEELAAIAELQRVYIEAVGAKDVSRMIEVNRNFHSAIGRAGRNRYYADLFDRLLDEGRRLLRLYYSAFDNDLPATYLEEHEAMIAAIERQDINAADGIAAAHAQQITRQITRQIQRQILAEGRVNADLPL